MVEGQRGDRHLVLFCSGRRPPDIFWAQAVAPHSPGLPVGLLGNGISLANI